MQPEPPLLPWQKVDVFEWEQKHYLLVVDYYSRYIEIARLANTMTNEVLIHTKSIFARHGIPEVLILDNGPQYASLTLPKRMGSNTPQVAHTSLRPTVRRNVLWELSSACSRKTKTHAYLYSLTEQHHCIVDSVLAAHGRTTVPSTQVHRAPMLVDVDLFRRKEQELKTRLKKDFDHHHGARDLPALSEGDLVWLLDKETESMVG